MQINMQQHRKDFEAARQAFRRGRILERIWARDYTVWGAEPEEIANRLGWLDVAERLRPELPRLRAFAAGLRKDGFTDVLLLGMGGSSLAPEVLQKTFGSGKDGLHLSILDSTNPGAVLRCEANFAPEKTLYLVSTKSGGTVETASFFKFFYNRALDVLGRGRVGGHFAAVTDPGSGLVETARRHAFREIFLNDPNIGGRYSALSLFGLVPAALLGINLDRLVERAVVAAAAARREDSPAVQLGLALGVLAGHGRDRLTLLYAPGLESLGDWVEQLVAESTGKAGKGILPVVGEPIWSGDRYWADRVFVHTGLEGQPDGSAPLLDALEAAGHPVIRIVLADRYDLGRQFFDWELATAIAGWQMGIQPFDQPNVEAAKLLGRAMVAAYQEHGELPREPVARVSTRALSTFLAGAGPGSYVGLHAYVTPSAEMDAALQALRIAITLKTGLAVTVAYGPRFLHSTGQLHKGDAGDGRFIQIVSAAVQDAAIPDEAGREGSRISFQVLKLSQALGDYKALKEASPPRRIIRFHLETNVAGQIRRFADELTGSKKLIEKK